MLVVQDRANLRRANRRKEEGREACWGAESDNGRSVNHPS